MSHPLPLVVEASYRRSEALHRAQQERLANAAAPQPEAGQARFGRQVAHLAGAIDRVTSMRARWSKVAPSRAAV